MKLECSVKGDQPITITWKKEDAVLNNVRSDRFEIFETITPEGMKSEMVLRSVDRSDSGLYLCTGENTFGRDERSNKLIVMESPGPPTNLQVRDSWSRSASVSWTAPSSGNSPILGYIIQHWMETTGENNRLEEAEVPASQTSFMVRNLKPDCAYRVSVLAVNELGRGQVSPSVSFKTGEEEPSAPPLDVMVESKGPTTIRVLWKPPPKESWHGSLTGYYVGFRHVNDYSKAYSLRTVPALLASNSSIEYFLSGLAKASEYAIVVKAYNKAGSGPESAQLVAKTLSGSLPPSPKLYLFTITHDSVSINAKMPPGDVVGNIGELSGFSIHYRRDDDVTWTEIGIPMSTGKKDGAEYVYGML